MPLDNSSNNRSAPSYMMYGTAHKREQTETLTNLAIIKGFRAIDTANEATHDNEPAVGKAVCSAISAHLVTRKDLFLQSKFTPASFQTSSAPYDVHAPVEDQVKQSFRSTLSHLGCSYLDSFLLHAPSLPNILSPLDFRIWTEMESLVEAGMVQYIGVCNFTPSQLDALFGAAKIKPQIVQNRCYAFLRWDHQTRQFCRKRAIAYQGFSILWENYDLLRRDELRTIARQYKKGLNQILYRFCYQSEIVAISGTTNPSHMASNLEILDFCLADDDMRIIETLLENEYSS